ncbi:MAG: G8 domain-containing protein [bacterium]
MTSTKFRPQFLHGAARWRHDGATISGASLATAVALMTMAALAGCGSNGGHRAATPTATAAVTSTPSPGATDPGPLCDVYGVGADACMTPTPPATFPPCSGTQVARCSGCASGYQCCAVTPSAQCFPAGGISSSLCANDPSQVCLVVATPTPTPYDITPPPCTGMDAETCKGCAIGFDCCPLNGGQCFQGNGIVSTACANNPSIVCLVAGTPTPTATGTVTATGTATVTATPTDTPVGGIPTPTLPPNTCDMTCDDTGPPKDCTALAPTGDPGTPDDLTVNSCMIVSSGQYVYHYVHVVDQGVLYFMDDGGRIDFRAASVLVQQGGKVKAGSWCCPFGSYGGKLDIGLWGIDPTDQGTMPPSTPGIDCVDETGFLPEHCFSRQLISTAHYCTVSGSDDPCSSTTPPADVGDNALFEGNIGHGSHATATPTTSGTPATPSGPTATPTGDPGLPFDEGAAFGYKVLAVTYGGSLELFGAKGVDPAVRSDPSVRDAACAVPAAEQQNDPTAWAALSGASWVRLNADAPAQSAEISLDRPVDWQQGDRVVVGSTDWYAGHSEEMVLSGLAGGTTAAFTLSTALNFDHAGEIYDVAKDVSDPPSPHQQVETRAAVGLLSRDIHVYSLGDTYDEPFPSAADCGYQTSDGTVTTPTNCYFGGHVIARQGFRRFQIQGVEFSQLGQGGRLAHYPVHFHMAKSTAYTNAFIKDSAIDDSMTRFVTVHATHDVTVARNVGYLSMGHGFYIEDGSEIDNLICHNLAVGVRGSLIEYFQAQDPSSPTYRFVPPILPSVSSTSPSSGAPYGSDSYFPVGFWMMNTWNEFVGNQVVGVGGFGSCYWLLGSGVSGPSQSLHWSTSTTTPYGYADYNEASSRQAPLKRFRGNGCSTSQYALQTTLQVDPPLFNATQYGYTPALNPYAITNDMLPQVGGDYLPLLIGGVGCATQRTAQDTGGNADSCSLTLIDRFTTAFNWAPIDFGAIWLRPQFYAFTNGSVTDQLFGGITFVSGGAWTQAPPGYFTITQDGVYAGNTHPHMPDAGRVGPAFDIASCAQNDCPLPIDGTALFVGGFQPKRLINIYDGPFFAEGNAFADAPALECDPTKVTDGTPECGIYMSTVQPTTCDGLPSVKAAPDTAGGMCVIDAVVGWKQPNGFYYPPAFAFENTAFGTNTVRHNVVDQYNTYVQGTLADPPQPSMYSPLQTYVGITPIDSSTILNDLDGSFTGTCWGDNCDALADPNPQRRTASVSANHFFDAPSQAPECLSYGVQTSPNELLTSVIAPLTGDGTAIDPSVWGTYPAVPIYRQRLLSSETPCAGSICDGTMWSCDQATFMMGAENGQAPYLTADNGVYYIDTDSAAQTTACIANDNFSTAPFAAGTSYVVYQLFSKDNSKTTYQLYTGPTATGQWVWVQPHLTSATGPSNNLVVTPITDTTLLPKLEQRAVYGSDGVLQVTFDNSLIADEFTFTLRDDDEKCIPRDACAITTDGAGCGLASGFADPGLAGIVGSICEKWATRVAGTTAASGGLSLSDCPASGCLGYSFTLPSDWTAESYATAGAPLVSCFPQDAAWDRPLQVISQDATVCAAPPTPAGFCPMPTPTP